jgi:pantoate--beta-alanine ligase
MGYLHEGHISLIKKSKEKTDITVVSIFVNPIQFSASEDLTKYPRDIEHDKKLLKQAGVDYVFIPSAEEIYPEGFQTFIEVDKITKHSEGEFRPTHFKGVTTVVAILFNIIKPDYAFFGRKDAQQSAVVTRMVKDLKIDTEIVVCPIIREPDGLAKSSRNIYLSPQERKDSLVLIMALKTAEKFIKDGKRDIAEIIKAMINIISSVKTSKLDYIRIVEVESFEEAASLSAGKKYYILIACKIGKTRLIDNLLIKV